MKQSWKQLEQRFAGLTRRERAILLIGGLALVGLVGFSLIDSSLAKQRVIDKQIVQARAEAAGAQAQAQTIIRQLAQDPDARAREAIDRLVQQVSALDAEMKSLNRGLVPPQEMASILEKMLTRDSRVKLVRLKTLPVSFLIARGEKDPGANVYKHGIELTLQGGYLDLVRYLDALEALPWQMFWSQANLDAADYPVVRITITVFTLSLDKNWLVV